jgi:hypothetical protein
VESQKERGAMGNLKRWNKDLYDLVMNKTMTLQEALFVADDRKPSHKDTPVNGATRKDRGGVAERSNLTRRDRGGVAKIADTDTVSDTVNVKDIDNKRFAVTIPHGSEEFLKAWTAWVEYRKEIKKPYQTFSSQQAELDVVGKYPEKIATEMITQSLKNCWKNIRPLDLLEKNEPEKPKKIWPSN